MRSAVAITVVFCVAAFAGVTQEAAQVVPSAREATDVDVVPVVRVNPDYPARALSQGSEGWVELSFVVSATGDVLEPMIERRAAAVAFSFAANTTALRLLLRRAISS